ncbi:MAG: tetratricopeptide repeat protein [Spirochaetales bacterium]|nr:tetratricopeptide repeat protein [Spirochaetales bacterium]
MNDRFDEGIRLYKSRRYQLALEEFLSCDEKPADSPDLSYYVGLCYTKLEKYEDALLYLENVVTLHENLFLVYQCRLILAYIYSITGRYRLAEFELEQLVESGLQSPQVYSVYGFTAYNLSKTEEGLKYLQKALTIDPDNANALNSIGYIMAEKEIDIPSAISYCKNAVKKRPENAAYLDSLGWAYFKDGQSDKAREILSKALNISGGHKTIALHMREVLRSDSGEEDS